MLYMMRHGKTEWNGIGKLQGRTDIPLNEEGIRMAEEANERYRDVPIDVCYCSPLMRAKQTAQIVLQGRELAIISDERLKEMSFGELEGEYVNLKDENAQITKFFLDPVHYIPAGGETFAELFERTGDFLKEIEPQLKEGKDILIVGHGAMNASIYCQINQLSIEHFWDAGLEKCKLIKLK